ncbi:hypothetical protein P7K49_008708 [Saguinus oedipus]|uniref:Uncharacterized protein n=1 Tax=Saguinus oedipus TaxID=9490 RepID=A0ABQ9W226_SAGOE|nr:hypothetical protein P7K49_008708 [Saguinus oedipus]
MRVSPVPRHLQGSVAQSPSLVAAGTIPTAPPRMQCGGLLFAAATLKCNETFLFPFLVLQCSPSFLCTWDPVHPVRPFPRASTPFAATQDLISTTASRARAVCYGVAGTWWLSRDLAATRLPLHALVHTVQADPVK